jgi:uracil-DNA glycosylase
MELLVFVGSNPSNASSTESAFHESSKSFKILNEWIKDIKGEKKYVNVSNEKTESNRPLKVSEIKSNLPRLLQDIAQANKVIALGKTAAKAVSMLGIDFYEMPHPSGLNRLLNDPEYVKEKIKGLQTFCNPSKGSD